MIQLWHSGEEFASLSHIGSRGFARNIVSTLVVKSLQTTWRVS
jgi:hypothetical protein